jgi:hypothetical protein
LFEEERLFSLTKIDNLKISFAEHKRVNIRGTLFLSSDGTNLKVNFITHCSLNYYNSNLIDKVKSLGFIIEDKKASPV